MGEARDVLDRVTQAVTSGDGGHAEEPLCRERLHRDA